ncbi:MAG TPA: DUF4214 domain-containing protein [Pyrinomonadaceae bacterium]
MKFAVTLLIVALTAITAFGQNAPTLRIVTEDPNLPSELFYGDIKVKPLRLRPGTNQRITIDDSDFFIQMHYNDFLNRMPEPAGFQGWMNILNNCQPGNTACDRIEVSSAFFRSAEFADRGYFVFRFYLASLGRNAFFREFMPDLRRVSGFQDASQLEASKVAYVNDFMALPEFKAKYDALTTPTAYVDGLLQTAGLPSHPTRDFWINGLTNGTLTRAQVLRSMTESSEVYNKYYNTAFVVMQYFGYLRRDPDILYLEWIKTMDRTGDYRTMINGFMNSAEYRNRF